MVLVDTSVWIEYFRGNEQVKNLNDLIDSNTLAIFDFNRTIAIYNTKKREQVKKTVIELGQDKDEYRLERFDSNANIKSAKRNKQSRHSGFDYSTKCYTNQFTSL